MTDWETTKIKGDVKAKAREDPRTYTEIMRAGLDQQNVKENAQEAVETIKMDDALSTLEERLGRLEEAIKEATNAAQSADKKLEDLP